MTFEQQIAEVCPEGFRVNDGRLEQTDAGNGFPNHWNAVPLDGNLAFEFLTEMQERMKTLWFNNGLDSEEARWLWSALADPIVKITAERCFGIWIVWQEDFPQGGQR